MFSDDVFCFFHMHIILLYLRTGSSGIEAEGGKKMYNSFCTFTVKCVNNTINCSRDSIFAHVLVFFCGEALNQRILRFLMHRDSEKSQATV